MVKSFRFFNLLIVGLLIAGLVFALPKRAAAQVGDNPNPPEETVKLVFVHHSTGENWLRDDWGGLGMALDNNHYFVSDTNYGWGPNGIGDRTDIVNWKEWFGPNRSEVVLNALFNEGSQNSSYTRTQTDPGGENEIIMFKSCFPNSALGGAPNDPPADGGDQLTVGNAKYIYNTLLEYFITRPDKMFVIITAPPLIDASQAGNARAFNSWLMTEWLKDYQGKNVFVFDFFNILTHPNNHHRFVNGAVQYVNTYGSSTEYYPSSGGDDHPNQQGSQKATNEYVPLLNVFYHRWKAGISNPVPTVSAISPASGPAGGAAFTLTVAGTGFVSGSSTVRWKGANRVTTFISSTKLRANILAADLVTPGTAAITVFTAAPGGGTSLQTVNYTINKPVPTVSAISPASGPAGGAAFTLTVAGTGFVSGSSTVRWKGANRVTTFVSSTKLRANILAADLVTPGTAAITVFTTAPGGGTSVQTVCYTISNRVPTVSAISPTSGPTGGAAFIMTVAGTGFVSGSSTVRWKGANRVTTFVSSTKLRANILAADLATGGTAAITVFTTAPGGGTSIQTVSYTIVNPVPTVSAINPTSGPTGGAAFIMTVAGTGFVKGSSTVRWKGVNRITTFVSSTKLRASILAADLAAPGTAAITVFTTSPGGGTSVQTVSYTIGSVSELALTGIEAWAALIQGTHGDSRIDKTVWRVTQTPCSWLGVACSDGDVMRIFLLYHQLTGSISLERDSLTLPIELWLSNHQLSSSIPVEMAA